MMNSSMGSSMQNELLELFNSIVGKSFEMQLIKVRNLLLKNQPFCLCSSIIMLTHSILNTSDMSPVHLKNSKKQAFLRNSFSKYLCIPILTWPWPIKVNLQMYFYNKIGFWGSGYGKDRLNRCELIFVSLPNELKLQ